MWAPVVAKSWRCAGERGETARALAGFCADTPGVLFTYLEGFVQILFAVAFGYAIGLGDLIERKGYRWFPGAGLAIGVAAGALGAAMIWLSLDGVRAFWLASLATWVLFGRMFAPGKLVTTLLVGGYLASWTLTAENLDVPMLTYFGIALLLVTGARFVASRSKRIPPWLRAIAEKESWASYLVVAAFLFFFELDLGLVGTVWAFYGGLATFDDESHLGRLRTWGVKAP